MNRGTKSDGRPARLPANLTLKAASYLRVREPLASNPSSPCLASSSIESIWPCQMNTINGQSQLRNLKYSADNNVLYCTCTPAVLYNTIRSRVPVQAGSSRAYRRCDADLPSYAVTSDKDLPSLSTPIIIATQSPSPPTRRRLIHASRGLAYPLPRVLLNLNLCNRGVMALPQIVRVNRRPRHRIVHLSFH